MIINHLNLPGTPTLFGKLPFEYPDRLVCTNEYAVSEFNKCMKRFKIVDFQIPTFGLAANHNRIDDDEEEEENEVAITAATGVDFSVSCVDSIITGRLDGGITLLKECCESMPAEDLLHKRLAAAILTDLESKAPTNENWEKIGQALRNFEKFNESTLDIILLHLLRNIMARVRVNPDATDSEAIVHAQYRLGTFPNWFPESKFTSETLKADFFLLWETFVAVAKYRWNNNCDEQLKFKKEADRLCVDHLEIPDMDANTARRLLFVVVYEHVNNYKSFIEINSNQCGLAKMIQKSKNPSNVSQTFELPAFPRGRDKIWQIMFWRTLPKMMKDDKMKIGAKALKTLENVKQAVGKLECLLIFMAVEENPISEEKWSDLLGLISKSTTRYRRPENPENKEELDDIRQDVFRPTMTVIDCKFNSIRQSSLSQKHFAIDLVYMELIKAVIYHLGKQFVGSSGVAISATRALTYEAKYLPNNIFVFKDTLKTLDKIVPSLDPKNKKAILNMLQNVWDKINTNKDKKNPEKPAATADAEVRNCYMDYRNMANRLKSEKRRQAGNGPVEKKTRKTRSFRLSQQKNGGKNCKKPKTDSDGGVQPLQQAPQDRVKYVRQELSLRDIPFDQPPREPEDESDWDSD